MTQKYVQAVRSRAPALVESTARDRRLGVVSGGRSELPRLCGPSLGVHTASPATSSPSATPQSPTSRVMPLPLLPPPRAPRRCPRRPTQALETSWALGCRAGPIPAGPACGAIVGEGAPACVPAALPSSPQEGGAPHALPRSNTVPGACSTGGIGAILLPVGASGYR
jgi:hypothetical protein